MLQPKLLMTKQTTYTFLAVLTDANARLGLDNVLFSYNKITNDNGKRHLHTMEELLTAKILLKSEEESYGHGGLHKTRITT